MGNDSLLYQVCDNGVPSLCDMATLLLHIGNTPPDAVQDITAVTEDIPATGNVLTNDTDAEGDALTALLVRAPVNSSRNDFGILLYDQGRKGFISSDRRGNDDLWV